MLKPQEIFAQMPPALADQLFTFFFEREKPFYKATIDTLATQRKLRPVFVERKPRPERHLWMKETVSRKQNEAVAAQLLQIWLVGAHKDLLCAFLDALHIPHDADGTLNEIPPSPSKADLSGAVDTLLEKFDPGLVSVYLHAFQCGDQTGWPALAELLEEDPRLRLSAAAGGVPAEA